jgi:hypothetical protein
VHFFQDVLRKEGDLTVEEVDEQGGPHHWREPLLRFFAAAREVEDVLVAIELGLLVKWDNDRHQELDGLLEEGAIEPL